MWHIPGHLPSKSVISSHQAEGFPSVSGSRRGGGDSASMTSSPHQAEILPTSVSFPGDASDPQAVALSRVLSMLASRFLPSNL